MRAALPPSIRVIQNDAFRVGALAVAGTRLWQLPWVSHTEVPLLDPAPSPVAKPLQAPHPEGEENMKYVRRELHRLELSLKRARSLDGVERLVAMVHYPPVDERLRANEVTDMLERYGVSVCVYGHLHNLDPEGAAALACLEMGGIRYHLVSCDFTGFRPVRIF